MGESNLRQKVLELLRPLHAIAIENGLDKGTPDVNCSHGWLELKHLDNWPTHDTTIVRPPHFKPEQRMWLQSRCLRGGSAWLLLRVGREWMLVWGTRAASHVGISWTRPDLVTESSHVAYWPTSPSGEDMVRTLVLRRWSNG